ncbi:MAG: family N-acetyltransferase [Thermoleophilia bacterium]|nr:family N-acetyltransferase [Thermoleophilia bacterium]
MTEPVEARPIDATATYDLRHRVLRPDAPMEDVQFDGDELATTHHMGAFRGDALIAIATVYREARPDSDGDDEWRLRGMAAEPAARGTGAGRAALDAIEAHARAEGGRLLWCNARTPAIGFYERAGWIVLGEEFEIPSAGPHYVMEKPLS